MLIDDTWIMSSVHIDYCPCIIYVNVNNTPLNWVIGEGEC